MNEIVKIFSNEEFGEIRVINPDGEPWFVARDIAEALGYSDTDQAVRMHCKYPKLLKPVELSGLEIGPRGMYFIPESDMYRLIMRSNLPKAEKFQDWVVEQVLPSIRKHDGYVKGQEHLSDDELMAKAIMVAQRKIKEKELALQEAIRTKAHIGDKRQATTMARLSWANRKVRKLEEELGRTIHFATIGAVFRKTGTEYHPWRLMRYCEAMSLEIPKVRDERWGRVNTYPAKAWRECYGISIYKLFA